MRAVEYIWLGIDLYIGRNLGFTDISVRTVARKFSIGGICVCARGLDIIKLTKILIYSVSRFNLGGLELCLGGKAPPCDGTDICNGQNRRYDRPQ